MVDNTKIRDNELNEMELDQVIGGSIKIDIKKDRSNAKGTNGTVTKSTDTNGSENLQIVCVRDVQQA